MWKTIRKNNKFILRVDNEYYLLNEDTYELIEAYSTGKEKELQEKYELSDRDLQTLYNTISKTLYNPPMYLPAFDEILSVQWRITSNCNLSCRHCYISQNTKEISMNAINRIIDQIIDEKIMSVTITGGEPLLVKDIDKIVRKLLLSGIHVKICTNGLLLPTFLNHFSNEDDIEFMISLDGTENCHDAIRGKGTFKKAVEGINFANMRGFPITINIVLNKINYLSIPELISYLAKLKIKKVQISEMWLMGNALQNQHELLLSKEEHNLYVKKIFEQKKELSGMVLSFSNKYAHENDFSVYKIAEDGTIANLGEDVWRCAAGQCKVSIDELGDIYCCNLLKSTKLGSLLTEDFNQLLNSENRYRIVSRIVDLNKNNRICTVMRRGIEESEKIIQS